MKVNDIVYIHGNYKAKIHKINSGGTITCRIYEGAPKGNEHRNLYTYQRNLIKKQKHEIS
jgi:hypothetical protein